MGVGLIGSFLFGLCFGASLISWVWLARSMSSGSSMLGVALPTKGVVGSGSGALLGRLGVRSLEDGSAAAGAA